VEVDEGPEAALPLGRLRGAAVVLLVGLAVALTWVFFAVRVCDEQLAASGRPVEVCRHLSSTDPPVLVVGAVFLACMGLFFTEVSGLGFAFKREVQRRLEDVSAQAAQVAGTVDEVAEEASELRGRIGPAPVVAVAAEPVAELAQRYETIRWERPAGAERTRAMEQVVSEMRNRLGAMPDVDVGAWLTSPVRADRLAAYAWLCEHLEPRLVGLLSRSALDEDKDFGQHVGLRALRHQVKGNCDGLDTETHRRLAALLERVKPTSGRAGELRRILSMCPPP
jgi:hypothetical protein